MNVHTRKFTEIDSIPKPGKTTDDDLVASEHFFHASASWVVRLQHLLTSTLHHGFVPRQFQYGTIIPIVKDHHRNHGDMHNYRGTNLFPIKSKIFAYSLRFQLSEYLTASRFQFGYKQKSSMSQAVFCYKETVNHYVEKGKSDAQI